MNRWVCEMVYGKKYSPFAGYLKALRDTRRWSQERLAVESDMDHSLVSRLESDQRNPTREATLKLSEGMALRPDQRDRLLVLGGHVPVDLANTIAAEPGLAALYRFLQDDALPEIARGRVRDLVNALANLTVLLRDKPSREGG